MKQLLCGLLLIVIPCLSVAQDVGVDIKHLPIGDGNISDQPMRGHLWSCRKYFRGGGAHALGDWFNGDGTYDLTAKPLVDGKVDWPHSFNIELVANLRRITSNDLPNHPTGNYPISEHDDAYDYDRNPNEIQKQDFLLKLPAEPRFAGRPSCVRMGPIGFLLTGGVFFNALDARGEDAIAHEIQDACQGHPQRRGIYHYHSLTTCLEKDTTRRTHSDLVGYALDGFGLYGRLGEAGKPVTNKDLDECHGHTHKIIWDGKKSDTYHYHATWEYPYTVGCYRGAPERISGVRRPGPPRR